MISEQNIYVGFDVGAPEALPVGLLKFERQGMFESGEFVYGKNYLQDERAIPIHPELFPLRNEPFPIPQKRVRDGGALPLTFKDALPDSWGRKVLEAQYEKKLSDIETLCITNEDRVGALMFSETLPIVVPSLENCTFQIEDISNAIRKLELSMEVSQEMRRLLKLGGSLGGARPKTTIVQNNKRYLAKFPALGDDHDVELLEKCLMDVAQQCGIEVAPSDLLKVGDHHALLVERFDREGFVDKEVKKHYLSASALLNIPYESHEGSYVEFANALRKISIQPTKDLEQLFLRLVFNLIIDNTDDHIKNHGVIHVHNGQYRLSPAFDVVMQMTNLGYQELAIKPGVHHSKISYALEIAPLLGINVDSAKGIVENFETIIPLHLLENLQKYGASTQLISRVKQCLERQHNIIWEQ